ncbi:Methanogenesis regulatory histidine kinase FilI [uncultured archaeon]|nr:Methanogenesis regulatory histidine kinase FilI [uncultured archaeon]
MLTDFFIKNLDVVFFIYGFAFTILGIIIFVQLRVTKQSKFRLLDILWLLAWFGFIHGISEFIDMFKLIKGNLPFLEILGASVLFISFLSLFLFGYGMINIGGRKRLGIWFPFTIALLFLGMPALSGATSFDTWNISSRYFLGFPGAILSATGFISYYKSEAKKLDGAKIEKYFILIALLFGLYGIFGGWIVPQANFYPASAINNVWFISWFGFPVQMFRALIAVGIAWSLWNIVNIFNIEEAAERKLAEEKIREQSALLDKAHDAIGVWDLEQHFIYWNKGAEHLYGWAAEEIIGKNADELLYKEESARRIEAKKSVIEKGEWAGELYEVTKDGKEVIVESRWTMVRDDAGKPKSILVINTDITEKKKLEAQFLRAQRMESIGTLAGGIAHDLNNVLTPIMLSLQLLKDKYIDEDCQKLLDMLDRNTKRGADLIKQVLSFARGVEGERNPLQAKHIITEIEKVAKETFPRNIEIRTDIPKDLWRISGDATQLHQVIMNLCVNARDAMPSGGTLSITASNFFIDENYARMHTEAKVGSYIVIAVSDTGTGISPEVLDRIFEPFFTTKEHGKGTGLGLSTALGIVKSHGGFINVYSEVGKGTTFQVYLPAIKTEIKDAGQHKLELPVGNGEFILVAEDEVSICEITCSTLEAYGYKVLTAEDGEQAVALYTENKDKIKIVLMDMMMPVMDGQTSIRAIRKINPEVKIIAVSGLSEKDRLANIAHYTNAFLPKPYTAEKLLKTMHEVLSAK